MSTYTHDPNRASPEIVRIDADEFQQIEASNGLVGPHVAVNVDATQPTGTTDPRPARVTSSPSISGGQMDRIERWGLLAGAGFSVLQLSAVATFMRTAGRHMPPIDAGPELHAAFYAAHWGTLAWTNYLFLVSLPLLLVFLGTLVTALRRAERTGPIAADIALVSGIGVVLLFPMGIAVAHAGQYMAQRGLAGTVVFAFDSVAQITLAVSAFPRTVFLASVGAVLLRTGHRWVGWAGILLAPVALVSTASLSAPVLFPLLALGTVLFYVWILALSVALLRGAGR